MSSAVMAVALIVANVLGAAMIVPQVVRLHRMRTTAGLSGPWIGVGIVMNSWWVAFATATELWGILPVSAAGALLYSFIAVQYTSIRGPGSVESLMIGAVGLGSIPLPFLVLGGWNAAGIVIGLSYGVQFLPAAITAVRSNHLDGLSPSTWVMAWIEAAVWFAYGLSTGGTALVLGGGGGLAMSTVILVQVALSEKRPALELADVPSR